jgi:hypothetical protein
MSHARSFGRSSRTAAPSDAECRSHLRFLRIGYALMLLASLGAFAMRASVPPAPHLVGTPRSAASVATLASGLALGR